MNDDFDEDVPVAEEDFADTFLAGISGHARSHQRRIGPSGIGTPCPRKLAYQLAESETDRRPHTELRQTVGTAVHSWVEGRFQEHGGGRWLTETKVYVGDLVTPSGTTRIDGTSDLYHVPTATVVDLKVPGAEGVKKLRLHGLGQTYRVQGHLYGCGYANLGYPVRAVAVIAVPAAGEWRDRVWCEEPFNPRIAQAGLDRASKVLGHIEKHGLDATLEKLKPVNDFCRRCEFARPATGRGACPTATPQSSSNSLKDLLKKKR
jgi:hypothetical protein